MSIAFENNLNKQLAEFDSHGLQDLNRASLMNRVDTKFIIPVAALPQLLDSIHGLYTALEINGRRFFRYQSTYFDTEDFSLYHLHHNKRLNRHKVRTRHYVDDDSHFLEVKFKNNKKRTIKSRIQLESCELMDITQHHEFLKSTGLPSSTILRPSLVSQYKRIAFASESRGERLTIDFSLTNHTLGDAAPNQSIDLNGIAIAELKQGRLDRHSPFFQKARDMNLRATSFSKYCMGIALTMPNNRAIKSNRFKRITRKIPPTTTTKKEA